MKTTPCTRCGKPIDAGVAICPNCGAAHIAAPPAAAKRASTLAVGVTVACLGLAGLMTAVLLNRERADHPLAASSAPPPDYAKTKTLAESGDPQAAHLLGDIYSDGKQVRQSYAQAAEWYRKAGEQGVAAAQYKLGVLYGIGQGVAQDESAAAVWYRKAAEQGNTDAQYTLAGMYGLGRGVPRDPKEALRWYQAAAERGEPLACYNLAERYERGRDVTQDFVEAFKWHSLAAERGLADGAIARDNLKKSLSSAQLTEARQRIGVFNAQHPRSSKSSLK